MIINRSAPWVAGLAVLGSITLAVMLGDTRKALVTAQFRADSAQAAGDTSRRLILAKQDSLRILGDSLGAVTRRAVQQSKLSTDALDRATKSISALRTTMTAQFADLNTKIVSSSPTTVDSSGTRYASFEVDSTPYHATARVAVPVPPAKSTIDLRVHLDTIRLRPRVICGEPVDGIRPASVAITGPAWLGMHVEDAEISQDVCNADAKRKAEGGGFWWNVQRVGLFGLGMFVGSKVVK